MKKILIINPFGIGDVLFTTPVIESLSARTGGSRIGFLCNRRTEPLLRADPKIEWVFVYEKDELRALWRGSKIGYIKKLLALVRDISGKRFDAAIDLSLNREYGFLCWLAGIKERIGFNYKGRGSFLTKRIEINGYYGKHVIEYYLGLLRFIGVEPLSGQKEIRIYLPGEDREWARGFLKANGVREGELLIGIAPAGGASWGREAVIKHWRSEGFAGVADLLIEKLGAKIVIFGSGSEIGICEKTTESMRNPAVIACGKATLLQSAALMSMCRLVIANDGGSLHLAVAAGARTVGIFGPVDERVYGQYPPGKKHRVVAGKAECRPCYKNFKLKSCDIRKCLDSIGTEEVFSAAEETLKT